MRRERSAVRQNGQLPHPGRTRASPAKITRPRYARVLPRKRLFRLLQDRRQRIIWISGPPGAGKTTLVSSYLAEHDIPHLWYQLDAGDNDPATFFHYLGLAVRNAAPRHHKPLPHLTAEYLAGLPVFARRYFEALAARFRPPFVLVFDNYQDVAPEALLHAVLAEGFAALPEGFTAIVSSRTPAPPEHARLAANDQLALIGWEDLQLTLKEVEGIGRMANGTGATNVFYAELHRKTDGWAAGLVLLLEQGWAAGATTPDGSTPQILFDYFAGEIFTKLEREAQAVLLASALLPKMTASTVAQLTDFPSAGRVLADLNRKNYFTLRHPHPEPVYEYHPLFREFLLARAGTALGEARFQALQKSAAALLLAEGQIEHAAGLVQACGDWDTLVRLIRTQAQSLVEQGRTQMLQGWLRSLPADIHAGDPWLGYWHGLCRLPFDPVEARGHFERAYRRFWSRGDHAGLCLAWCGLVDSYVYEWHSFKPLEPWIAEMEAFLAAHPGLQDPGVEAEVACAMFLALMYLQPQHPDIGRWEQRVRQVILHARAPHLQIKVGNHLLIYYTWWTGDLAKAELLIDTLRAQAEQREVAPMFRISWLTMAAGYYWMSAANAEAIACVDRGLAMARTTGVHTWDMLLCAQGVFASLSSGETEVAACYLQRMEAALDTSRPLDAATYYYLSGWYRLTQGNLAGAREFTQTAVSLTEGAGVPYFAAVMRNDLGRVLLYLGEKNRARNLIAQSRAEGRAMRIETIEYLTLTAEAEVAMRSGEESACLRHLRAALAIGQRRRFQSHAWWSGDVMARLYARALRADIEANYVRAVIGKRGLHPPGDEDAGAVWPYPVRIQTLGRFSVRVDGRPLAFSTKAQKKPLDLLKALIALGAEDVSEPDLIDCLWPDAEGDRGQHALEMTRSRLRKLLGHPAAVLAQGGRLSLNRKYVWVDVWSLGQVLNALEGAVRTEAADEARITALSKHVLALYTGPFLPEEREAPWALSLRERCHTRVLGALRGAGQVFERAGHWREAAAGYEHALMLDPLAEEFYRRLMLCYRALERPAEGLAVYRRCRQSLHRLLGVAPARETEAIAQTLREVN